MLDVKNLRVAYGESEIIPHMSFSVAPKETVAILGRNGLGAEISRNEDGWTVELPVPGLAPEQIDVTVEDRVLTVTGKSDRRSFQRSFVIPEEIDTEAIEARVANGLLTLGLRLHPKAQPRKIAVKVASEAKSVR